MRPHRFRLVELLLAWMLPPLAAAAAELPQTASAEELPQVAAATELRLAVHETRTLVHPGASAAFAVDPTVVEASVFGGQVVLIGRHVGQTLVTVIKAGKVDTLTVRVEAPPTYAATLEASATRSAGAWEGRYDSATRRFSTGLSMALTEGERTARLRLYGIYEREQGRGGELWALPSASLEFTEPGRSLVLLDQFVDVSPLTLDGTVLRGVHLHQGPLEVHAGIASATPWDDLLLPKSGDRAVGLSYRSDRGGLRLIPSVFWLPDSDADMPGVVSLGFEHGAEDDGLRLKGELGWSGKLGASFDLSLRTPQRQAWLAGAYRPAGFAALNVARPAGSYLDGAWSERVGERTTAAIALSASRLELADRRPQAASGRIELRHQASERWSVTAGAGGGGYRDARAPTLHRGTVSLGTAYDAPGFGVAVLYRYQDTSTADRGGHGGRLTIRAAHAGWRANLFLDAQQQAPTLDLILRDRPDLARAFAELGFVAASPEEVVRLLRDNAALFAEHGIEVGPLRTDPLRLQGGLDLSWREPGPRRAELGFRLLADDAQGVVGGRRTYLATLYGSWRIFRDTELALSYTRWSTRREGESTDDRGSFQIALRTSLSAPQWLGGGGRAITGWVVRDDDATGTAEVGLPPVAGVEVVLDRWRRTRTDSDGRFVFDAPGPGEHRVEAVLPRQPGAYFTVASVATVPAGGEARFAVTLSAARLSGVVRSDAGLPLAGVSVRLEGPRTATAVTDSSGAYRFAGPAGEARISLVADSIPAGYDLAGLSPQVRQLASGAPAVADFTVRAQRVMQGVVSGTRGQPVTVTAVELDRSVSTDEAGRFLLRGLPAGPLTLVVGSVHGQARQVVELPAEPGSLTGIEIAGP